MKRYMVGNLVKYENKIHKISSVTDKYITLEECGIQHHIGDGVFRDIPLTDDFFLENGYTFNTKTELFIPKDGYGPAIKRNFSDCYFNNDKIEYSITGIIIRTVDEFQNLMNIIHCERITDNIKYTI